MTYGRKLPTGRGAYKGAHCGSRGKSSKRRPQPRHGPKLQVGFERQLRELVNKNSRPSSVHSIKGRYGCCLDLSWLAPTVRALTDTRHLMLLGRGKTETVPPYIKSILSTIKTNKQNGKGKRRIKR